MAIENMYIIYFMHIDFIQLSSSNHWIKLNFDSKWTLSFKMLSYMFLSSFFMFEVLKKMPSRFMFIAHLLYLLYIIFFDENWWKMVHL
jgi:hypothetical protein